MFAWAEGRGALKASPAKGIEKPSAEISRDRTPNNAEIVEIWRAAESLGWPFGKAVQLLILTGQRREEVSGIAWSEIKFDTATWSIPAARSKNGLAHDVHLSTAAARLLRSLPRFVDKHENEVDLILTTTGNTSISGWGKAKVNLDAKILDARQNAAKEAGTDPKKIKPMEDWTLHDLRRSVATGMNNLGVLPHVADRILNHASAKKGGVMAVYNRAEYASERKAAMTVWAEHLERLLSGNRARVLPTGLLAHGA
jgi:integrase